MTALAGSRSSSTRTRRTTGAEAGPRWRPEASQTRPDLPQIHVLLNGAHCDPTLPASSHPVSLAGAAGAPRSSPPELLPRPACVRSWAEGSGPPGDPPPRGRWGEAAASC